MNKKGLSEISKKMLFDIVNQMRLGVNSWKHNATFKEEFLMPDECPKGADYQHIVKEIRDELDDSKKIGKRYSFKIGSRSFVINAVYPYRGIAKNIYPVLDRAIKKIYVWLFMANHYADSSCSPEMTIYWYLTKHKKELPREHEVIDRVHVNTAFTFACHKGSNSIYIFREEEWFKVLLHESFHSFGLDFALMPEDVVNKAMFSIFPIKLDLRFSESYAELWAEIINVLFISVINYPCNSNRINMNILARSIETKMADEIAFSMFQISKILKHNKMGYIELFSKNNYMEKTSVFSYYILKGIMIFYYNDFIEWCITHNDGLRFNKTEENLLSLVEFIKLRCRNPEILRTIGENKSIHNKTTMRMSISEL